MCVQHIALKYVVFHHSTKPLFNWTFPTSLSCVRFFIIHIRTHTSIVLLHKVDYVNIILCISTPKSLVRSVDRVTDSININCISMLYIQSLQSIDLANINFIRQVCAISNTTIHMSCKCMYLHVLVS